MLKIMTDNIIVIEYEFEGLNFVKSHENVVICSEQNAYY